MARSQTARKVSRPSTTRRFGVESLEGRELMAGNVDVTLSNGNLLLTGDNLGNGVQIRQISANKLAVVGLKQAGANTSINGVGFQVFSGVTGNVTFNMNGGNDQIDVTNGAGFFASQTGLPTTFQPVDFARNVTVNLGDGNDLLAMEDADVNGGLKIDGGFDNGVDTIDLEGISTIGLKSAALEIDTRGGADVIDIEFADLAGSVDIDSGNEADFVKMFFAEISGDLTIRTQAGDDLVQLFDIAILDDLLLDAGNDDDVVALVEVTVADEADVLMGFGDDTLQLFELIASNAELDGGPGTDRLEDAGGNVFGFVDVDSFEQIVDVS
jgi:ribosomal protein L27